MTARMMCLVALLGACGGAPPRAEPPPARVEPWRVPAGWRSETIAFPLGFAPTIAHRGVEELRFPPGMFDPKAPGYWSYAFVWRTEDPAALGADALAAELTAYFRGLVVAVDKDKRIQRPDEIVVRAQPSGAGTFALTAHVFDAFATGEPLDLVGTAARTACGQGAVWTIVFARANAPLRAELDALAAEAKCGQPVAAPPSR